MSERIKKMIADYEKNGWNTDFAVRLLTEINRFRAETMPVDDDFLWEIAASLELVDTIDSITEPEQFLTDFRRVLCALKRLRDAAKPFVEKWYSFGIAAEREHKEKGWAGPISLSADIELHWWKALAEAVKETT